ncbi:unnamed protein product [Euphydryas editha]|uniref:Peptidase S1 domain-containing protein n=1 Tax=Euphydryas editha TaxID=104508 RepID=A0AAU9U043_EUPED|nr:unnamed protein product [Euphydryas editha]
MEKSFFLPLFLLFCLIAEDVVSGAPKRRTYDSKNIDNRIVGGYNITIQDVPYQVLLYVQKGDMIEQCGGSIISQTYVLTAAHCLTGASIVYVIAGTTEADSGGYEYTTELFTPHPLYNSANSDYDVALINIRDGIKLVGSSTKTVKLADADSTIAPGTKLLVTGWGLTKENGSVSNNLMAVQVPTISNEECRKAYNTLTTRQFCAAVPEGGKDSCQGDSGGPAVATDSGVQVGIVSFGEGCARPGYPGVYIEVAKVRSWIEMNAGV